MLIRHMAQAEGFEPPRTVLETVMLPLHQTHVLPSLPAVNVGSHNIHVRKREPLFLAETVGADPTHRISAV